MLEQTLRMLGLMRAGSAAVLVSFVAGCTATSQIPLAENMWQIQADDSGSAASLTSEATAERAAEMTVAQGFDRSILRDPQTPIAENADLVSVDGVMFRAGHPQAAKAIDAAAHLKGVRS